MSGYTWARKSSHPHNIELFLQSGTKIFEFRAQVYRIKIFRTHLYTAPQPMCSSQGSQVYLLLCGIIKILCELKGLYHLNIKQPLVKSIFRKCKPIGRIIPLHLSFMITRMTSTRPRTWQTSSTIKMFKDDFQKCFISTLPSTIDLHQIEMKIGEKKVIISRKKYILFLISLWPFVFSKIYKFEKRVKHY